MKILFITSTYLGDAIISTGILEALRLQNPHAKFTLACGLIPAPLFEAMPQLEKLIPIQKLSYSRHWFNLWTQCIGTKWDMIVDVRGTGLSHFLWAKKRHIWRSTGHSHLRVHQLSKFMGIASTPPSKIHMSENHRTLAQNFEKNTKPILCLSPTANWDKKCWPLEHFANLAKRLTDSAGPFPNGTIAILGAPNQRKDLEPLLEKLPKKSTLDLVGKLPLPALGAFLERSALFVGNDSGLMHLASAVGTPTLGLFGPSPENIYGPWGEKADYIRTHASFKDAMDLAQNGQNIMGTLSVDAVMKKIHSFLKGQT